MRHRDGVRALDAQRPAARSSCRKTERRLLRQLAARGRAAFHCAGESSRVRAPPRKSRTPVPSSSAATPTDRGQSATPRLICCKLVPPAGQAAGACSAGVDDRLRPWIQHMPRCRRLDRPGRMGFVSASRSMAPASVARTGNGPAVGQTEAGCADAWCSPRSRHRQGSQVATADTHVPVPAAMAAALTGMRISMPTCSAWLSCPDRQKLVASRGRQHGLS